jgi:ABC-type transport system involved in multi-copper enzyme maturation permease subunit
VLLFNILVGPVFSAGSVTSERERQTLDLLLVTLVTPWQMLWGKLLSGLRVSSVLTSFLLWPVLLACIMPLPFWYNLPTMLGYLIIVALTWTFLVGSAAEEVADVMGVMSPFSATFALPLDVSRDGGSRDAIAGDLSLFFGFIGWSIVYNGALVVMMMRLFQVRWRVAD